MLSYIGGISVIPLIFLYLASYMFRFCEYHRMFLHYIVFTWIINITDYYVGIPISDLVSVPANDNSRYFIIYNTMFIC